MFICILPGSARSGTRYPVIKSVMAQSFPALPVNQVRNCLGQPIMKAAMPILIYLKVIHDYTLLIYVFL